MLKVLSIGFKQALACTCLIGKFASHCFVYSLKDNNSKVNTIYLFCV